MIYDTEFIFGKGRMEECRRVSEEVSVRQKLRKDTSGARQDKGTDKQNITDLPRLIRTAFAAFFH